MEQKQKEAQKLEETLEEKENLHAELAAELENLKEVGKIDKSIK